MYFLYLNVNAPCDNYVLKHSIYYLVFAMQNEHIQNSNLCQELMNKLNFNNPTSTKSTRGKVNV